MKMYESKLKESSAEMPFDVNKAVDELEKILSKMTKMPISINYDIENSSSDFGKKISFSTNDLVSKSGVFALAVRKAFITSFGSGITINGEKGESFWWVGVNLSYEGRTAGRNGMEIARAYYKFTDPNDTHWIFFMAGDNSPKRMT